MTRAWQTLARTPSDEGELELRRRGDDEFLILVGGRVLMNNRANRSELALAELACKALPQRSAPRVLIGGLGMGCTLRAALDALPDDASVTVVELNEAVAEWCRGPLAAASASALDDPRCALRVADVAAVIEASAAGREAPWDAIVLDLFEGPTEPARGRSRHRGRKREDPFFGARALGRTRQALRPDGVFALWSEAPQPHFETQLERAGFAFEKHRPGKGGGGLRHAVYVARPR